MGRYQAYPNYWHSSVPWLGEIPLGWEAKRLRFILVTNPSKKELLLPTDALASFVPMEAVGEYGGLNLESEKPIDEIGSGYTYFAEEDVVVAKITPCFENGKGALARGLTNRVAFGTTELHVLRAGDKLNTKFLFYLTISHPFRKLGEAEMYGAGGQKRVPERYIRNLTPGIPPLSEQQAIARFLDYKTAQIDALIAKREALLDKLVEKRAVLITQAITKGLNPNASMKDSGVAWLGDIPATWRVLPLRRYTECIQTGPFGSQLHSHEYVKNEYPVVNPTNLTDGMIVPDFRMTVDLETRQRLWRHVLRLGDIVLGRRGELGRAACVSEKEVGWLCGTGSMLIRIADPRLDAPFLAQYIRLPVVKGYLQVMSVGSTMDNLNADIIGRMPVIIPPLQEQHAIIAYLHRLIGKIQSQTTKIQQAINALKEYRTALIASAVTGKIDVRNVSIPEPSAAETAYA